MPSFDTAIYHAGFAVYNECFKPEGREKRFDHQRHIPLAALKESQAILQASKQRLRACRSFHELHRLVKQLISGINGVGPLVIYDTAERLGGYLGLYPERAYLHSGTKEGAQVLGLDVSRGVLEVAELPKALQALPPREIENFLCIYKDRFRAIAREI